MNSGMTGKRTPPKLSRCNPKGKITVYPEKEIETLYFLGQGNGWDTPKIVREAVTEALEKMAEELKQPAS